MKGKGEVSVNEEEKMGKSVTFSYATSPSLCL